MSDSLRVHGILQAKILEWVAFPFSRGSSQPRDQILVSDIAYGFFTRWAQRSPRILEWVAYPFSSGSSRPRNQTTWISGRFFTNWTIREVHYWRDCIFSIVHYCLVHYRLIDCRCVGWFLGFLSCFIYIYFCFCANIILFCLLYLCSIIWSQGA